MKIDVKKLENEINYIVGYRKPKKDWSDENYKSWVRSFNRRYDMYSDTIFEIDEIRNNILNNYGGVREFVKGYGGDYFDEEYVSWFMKVDYTDERLDEFIEKWRMCFPS